VYTGDQSKIMMNSRSSRNKRSNMEHTINRLLILIGVFFLLFCVISALLYNNWTNSNQEVWYLPYVIGIATAEKVKNFFVCVSTHPPMHPHSHNVPLPSGTSSYTTTSYPYRCT
jgi:hypothetical protein